MPTEVEQVAAMVVDILDRLGITYMIGGSVASGIHGKYRSTNGIDFVADVVVDKVPDLAAALTDFYADEDMIRDGVESSSSFSIIHLGFIIKVDVFLKADDAWTNEVWRRRRLASISADGSTTAYLPSVEDAILQKLRWFQMGGGVSDRQWSDVLGMLRIQGVASVDAGYLRHWAARIGVAELLEQALDAAVVLEE